MKSAIEQLKENSDNLYWDKREQLIVNAIFELNEKLNSILNLEIIVPKDTFTDEDAVKWKNHKGSAKKMVWDGEDLTFQNGVSNAEKAKQDIKNIQNIKGSPKGGEVG